MLAGDFLPLDLLLASDLHIPIHQTVGVSEGGSELTSWVYNRLIYPAAPSSWIQVTFRNKFLQLSILSDTQQK